MWSTPNFAMIFAIFGDECCFVVFFGGDLGDGVLFGVVCRRCVVGLSASFSIEVQGFQVLVALIWEKTLS